MASTAWRVDEPLDPAAWIPLSALALEGLGKGGTVEQRAKHLARTLADEVLVDDIGRPCLPRSVARELFAVRAERDEHTDNLRRQNRVTSSEPAAELRRRVRAIQDRQLHRDLGLDTTDLSAGALAELTADDHDERIKASGARMDEFLSGGIHYHRFGDTKE